MNPLFRLGLIALLAIPGLAHCQDAPLVTGLKNPESVVVAPNGKVFVSVIGEFNKDGDGAVVQIKSGKAVPFCSGLNDPKGLAAYQKWLFVADVDRVLKIDQKGKATEFAPAANFPKHPQFLNDVVVDPETGAVFVSDSGDLKGNGGAVYGITAKGRVFVVTNKKRWADLHTPNGLAMDGRSFLRMVDFGSGNLYRLRISDGKAEKIAEGFAGADGLAWDMYGQFYVSNWKKGVVHGIARPGQSAKLMTDAFQSAADLCYDPKGQRLLIPDMKAGTLKAISTTIPGNEIDTTPLAMKTEVAFPDLKLTNWEGISPAGKIAPLRAIFLTHAGDDSNRIFLATQRGVVHVFPNDQKVKKTKIFLDLEKDVLYRDDQNEQGLLGVAFHPNYKKNGEFFLFYTIRTPKLTNVLARFKVSKDDPNRADPDSREEIFRIERPFWNHDGGTIAFGKDGYLYVALGDGGAANDPYNNAQNRGTLLGNILRIDIDKKDKLHNYAIPKDNPFVGEGNVRPEIWCYGLRNVWRMSFDRKTGKLWAGDVGQNLYEEINILTRGGNFGWKKREALHPFGSKGVGPNKDMIDPIWEYHHDVGKSITGGGVYRGKEHPELQGCYIYGDYITHKIWALKYDEGKKRVVSNRPIADRNLPILSFGEDEQGEIYLLTTSPNGQGVYRFVAKD